MVISVLSNANNIFREEYILFDDSSDRRQALHAMEAAIRANVNVVDSGSTCDVQENATAERFGNDIVDGQMGVAGDKVADLSAVNVR